MEMETAVGMMILLVAQDLPNEGEDEEDVEETETPEFMVRMKRQSDWLTQGGKRNWAQAGKSSAWQPQKLRRSKGHTVSGGRKEEGRAPERRALTAQCSTA